jgi:Delta7-sterol 5-desaturase
MKKSYLNFIFTNTMLIGLGLINYNLLINVNNIFSILTIVLLKNYSLINLINNRLKNHKNISDYNLPIERYKGEFDIHVLSSAIIETIFIKTYMSYDLFNMNYYLMYDLFLFIPKSFIFEIIFDFFHYWTHYIAHNKYLYKYSHKLHHKFRYPIAITTYYQHPFDIIFTNAIPTMLTLYIINIFFEINYFTFILINIYKTYIEIAGHSNKILNNTTSFPQFMWLPKFLNIELSTTDHSKHHSLNNGNYSKRFKLWDKVFKTYI